MSRRQTGFKFVFVQAGDGIRDIGVTGVQTCALPVFFAADLAAWHYSIGLTKLANASLFGNTSSLLFPVYGFIVARMLPKGLQALAFALALVGAALLLGSSYELSARHLRGDLFADRK